jgi:CRISPR-associated protein Csd1
MILKALCDYYDRSTDVAPMNQAYVNFYYSIVLNESGDFIRLESLGVQDGMSLLVYRPEERTSAIVPHSFGDDGAYVLGIKDVKDEARFDISKEIKKNQAKYDAFKKDVDKYYQLLPNNKYVKAVHLFYSKDCLLVLEKIRQDNLWRDFIKSLNKNITFSLDGTIGYAVNDPEIITEQINDRVNNNQECVCLISGNTAKPVNTTYSTYVLGGKSNAKLVSFQTDKGYDSYGKKQGLNAPISEESEFKYTTALLKMLEKNSRNKCVLNTRTFVFWGASSSEATQQIENSIFELLNISDGDNDNPDMKVEQVRKVFQSINTGTLRTALDDRFYILGLAPNSARIAVVYWSECTLKEFADVILHHFADMEIIPDKDNKQPYYMGLKNMLLATLRHEETETNYLDKVTPNVIECIVKSITQGIPYPYTLYSSCIRRIKAECGEREQRKKSPVTTRRAAIIKAYLNRINDNNKKIQIKLDEENTNPGYLCGRLFAVLDMIQEDANKIHSIQERYMNSASSTPSSVFATILNLSSHHSEKLTNGSRIDYEKIKEEIIGKLPPDGFPAHLDLQDQGRFFVGFYQQRQNPIKGIKSNNYKITVMLDKENTNPGYLCGRLFAVLDKIQEDANKIHSIQERYMNSASTTPSSVFATILNLSSHHSEKLTNGSRIFYEKIKQEIMDKLPSDGFPAHLDLQNQGRFFVGFYQQRQELYNGKSE